MENIVFEFLKDRYDPAKAILLGLSGGPDSLALLYLLLGQKDRLGLRLAIAHVDHRWREASTDEAKQLQQLASTLEIPFYLETLNPKELTGNLEAACRKERLRFFRELCIEHNFQAVLLGHHADDQAETVLKKVLEGSDLTHLSGLYTETEIDGLTIWRPLLSVPKDAILKWLETHSLTPFEDHTNLDPKYLRGRFRTQIIPELSEAFGKNIGNSLCRIGEEAKDLSEYLDRRTQELPLTVVEGPYGISLDVGSLSGLHKIELKHLTRKFCQRKDFSLSHDQLDLAAIFLSLRNSNKKIICGKHVLYFNRGSVFLLERQIPDFERVALEPGLHETISWTINVAPQQVPHQVQLASDWKSAWKGRLDVYMPPGTYELCPPELHSPYVGSILLKDWWSKGHVPMFIRNSFPVVWKGGTMEHEFMTGRVKTKLKPGDPAIRITIQANVGNGNFPLESVN